MAIIPGSPLIDHRCSDLVPCLEPLAEFAPATPKGLGVEHYARLPDDHFNNAGHALFADFLLEKLAEASFAPFESEASR